MSVALRRGFVILLAILIIAAAIGGLASGGSVFRIIADIILIVLCLYGIYGAWYLSSPHLRAFTIVLCVLWAYILIYMIVNLVMFHWGIKQVVAEIVLLCILFLGIVASHDLSNTIYSSLPDSTTTFGGAPKV